MDPVNDLRTQITDYIAKEYPGILFTKTAFSNSNIFIPTPMFEMVKKKRGRKEKKVVFYGLYLEPKPAGTLLVREKSLDKILDGDYMIREKGEWWDLETEEQAETLTYFKMSGYCATFAVGIDACLEVVDKYLAEFKLALQMLEERAKEPEAAETGRDES